MFWKKKIKEDEQQSFGTIESAEEKALQFLSEKIKELFEKEKDVQLINLDYHTQFYGIGDVRINEVCVYCNYRGVDVHIDEYIYGDCLNNIENTLRRRKTTIDSLLDNDIFINGYKSGPLKVKFNEPYSKETIKGQICYKEGITLKRIIDFIGEKFPDMTDLEFEDEENREEFQPHECYEELIRFFKELAENNGEFETGNNVIFEEDEDFVV